MQGRNFTCLFFSSASVLQNFTARYATSFSVHLSWIIPWPEEGMSRYITHFIIYLSDTKSDRTRIIRIPRVKSGKEFVLRGLKPHTVYTVGIQAQIGSSENTTTVYQNFSTKEAGNTCVEKKF